MSALSVFRPARFGRLLAADALNIGRDPMLLFAIVLSLVPAIALPLARDAMNAAALEAFGIVDLARYLAAVALALPPFLIGWVTGFLLLEDRDEGILLALDTTPVGKTGFLAYRVAVTALVTLLITIVALPLVAPEIEPFAALAILLMIPTESVLAAVILPALARNKVEGLALTKLTNICSIVPLVAIIPSPLRYLGAIVPSYWIGEALNLSALPPLPLPVVFVLAAAVHVGVGVLLFRLLARRAG